MSEEGCERMKITIEGKSKEIFKLAKSVLLQLREQHEEDIQYGRITDTMCLVNDYFREAIQETGGAPETAQEKHHEA